MNRDEFERILELIFRAGAILLVVLYASGFLIVSFHNGFYGIVAFSLFRARLLSAGILFFIFLAFPAIETARCFGLFGLKPGSSPPQAAAAIPPSYLVWSLRTLVFFMSSWAAAYFLQLIFFSTEEWNSNLMLLWIFLSVAVAWLPLAARIRSTWPVACAAGSLAVIVIGFVVLAVEKKWTFLLLLAWFAAVNWVCHQVNNTLKNPSILPQVNWHFVLGNTLGIFTFFALVFYPKIRPAFGGGKPAKVVIEFPSGSPIDHATLEELWLIDEVDGGYCVSLSRITREAVFIPKTLVSAVYFKDFAGTDPGQVPASSGH
jgi:hypothetical protein